MRLWTAALDLLCPPKCPFCQKVLDRPRDPVCPACRETLPWLPGARGERGVDFADGCFSPLAYRGAVPQAIHRYKFGGVRAYAAPFAALMARCLEERLPQMPHAVTWAPLSRRRLRERGYDQAGLLAGAVGRELALPLLPTLEKTRHTPPQSEQGDASARRANALGAYRLRPGLDAAGKSLLLVDDVVTSGATLGECCRLLRTGGAERVWCLTLAQARPDGTDREEQRKN